MVKIGLKTKKPPLAARVSDYGTKELQAKGEVEYTDIDGGYKQARVTNQTVVERLYSRGQIEEHQYQAACILQNDYFRANILVSIKSKSVIDRSIQQDDYNNRLLEYCFLASKKRYEEAMKQLNQYDNTIHKQTGRFSHYRALIQYSVLDDGYLKDLKKANPSYVKIGVRKLREALDILARWYGNRK
jgi:hypothetical protein